jgi:hypothetical protein
VLQCPTSRSATSMGAISNKRGERAEEDQDKRSMMTEVSFPTPNPYNGPITPPGRPGKAYKLVTDTTVHAALFQQSNQKAPGWDSLGVPILKALFEWDSNRVTALVRQCLRLAYHPRDWKIAKGICIPKPGKKAYDQAKSFRVISLLSCLGKLVEKVAATLIADTVEENGALHLGQFGGRCGRSAADAAAMLVAVVETAWENKRIAAALMMDVKGAFPTVNRACLLAKMRDANIDENLVEWTGSFMDEG